MPSPRKCIIATPMLDGRCDALYAYSLAETVRLGMANGVLFLPLFVTSDALIQNARNDLFAMAYATDAGDCIWIDSDMGWDPAWPLRLLIHDADVVGGTARRKSDIETYVCKCPPDKLDVQANGLIEVEGMGLAFTRLSRKAMDTIWNASEVYRNGQGEERRWIFDVRPVGGQLMSEDIFMCQRLRAAGTKLWLDPSMTCAHVGRHVFRGDFQRWLTDFKAALAREQAPPPPPDTPKPTLH